VKFLLEESFPLALYHRLRKAWKDVEHVIELGRVRHPRSSERGGVT